MGKDILTPSIEGTIASSIEGTIAPSIEEHYRFKCGLLDKKGVKLETHHYQMK